MKSAGPSHEPVCSENDGARAELERLRVALRRQALVIATLSEAVSNFHRGLKALRAENVELRAERDELRDRVLTLSQAGSRTGYEVVELAIEASHARPRSPAGCSRGHWASGWRRPCSPMPSCCCPSWVTNSVRHSGVAAGDELVVRLRVWHDSCRIEGEDPGRDGAIAPRSRDPIEAAGMGLNVVQALSERRGLVHRRWADPGLGSGELSRRPRARIPLEGEIAPLPVEYR